MVCVDWPLSYDMTFAGHTSSHFPHTIHSLLYIKGTVCLSSCLIASAGQFLTHKPHLIQPSSDMAYPTLFFLDKNENNVP